MNLFSDLNPETEAQRELAEKIQALAEGIAAWMTVEGRRDHRQRPKPEEAPGYPELITLIRQICKLKEQGL